MDQTIRCVQCKEEFAFTERDQEFYTQNGWSPPKRCKPCRAIAKGQRESGNYSPPDRPKRHGYGRDDDAGSGDTW